MQNLDIECAELGRELAEIPGVDERLLNDALNVLEEQGPYAMFLYLQARCGQGVDQKALTFLKKIFHDQQLAQKPCPREFIKGLANQLDNLLFAKDLLRTAFSYARYHVKAKN